MHSVQAIQYCENLGLCQTKQSYQRLDQLGLVQRSNTQSSFWFKGATSKHAFQIWIAQLDRVPTRSRLLFGGMQISSSCLLCPVSMKCVTIYCSPASIANRSEGWCRLEYSFFPAFFTPGMR